MWGKSTSSLAEVLAAVRGGWPAKDIEALPTAWTALLEMSPAKALAATVRAAPVQPVKQRAYFMDAHDRYVMKAKREA
tara:strand:- start:92 stop:325 length:234 start_codon:yes stop_codon:yes gene_type:complete